MTTYSAPWDTGVHIPQFTPLERALEVDVAIIGGGIMGITSAYLLSKAGYSVAVLEKEKLLHGATGATTAFITHYIDTVTNDLFSMFGEKDTRTIFSSHRASIDMIQDIIQRENISCEFMRCPIFIYANKQDEVEELETEMEAEETLGVTLHLRQDDALHMKNAGYLELPNQAKFHPLQYLNGLLGVAQDNGVQFFEHTEAVDWDPGEVLTVHTIGPSIAAKHLIVATYTPFNRELFFKKAFYDTYVLELEIPHGAMPEGIYEDTLDPYHYIRIDVNKEGGKDRMIIGGEDHRSDIPVDDERCFKSLKEYLQKIIPSISTTLVRQWKGPIVESIDGLAWIGPHDEPNVYYATGFSGNGMTYSMIASKIITDAIEGTENLWAHVYRTDRVPTLKQLSVKGRDYTNELMGGAVKNAFLKVKENL